MPLGPEQRHQLKAFGANVRRERMERGLSQEALAERVLLVPRTIQKIESGTLNILLTTILRIQKGLGCRWDDLFGK